MKSKENNEIVPANQKVCKKGVNKVNYAERMGKALEYRKAGLSFQKISEKIGWKSANSAKVAVDKGLAQIVEIPARQLKKLQNMQLDDLQLAVWDKVTVGDLEAVRTYLKIMERRAKLNGLDDPQKYDIRDMTRAEDLTDDELANIAASGRLRIAAAPATEDEA